MRMLDRGGAVVVAWAEAEAFAIPQMLPEHLLLGVLREDSDLTAQVVRGLDADWRLALTGTPWDLTVGIDGNIWLPQGDMGGLNGVDRLNVTTGKIDFFNAGMRSRMPLSPWYGDRVRLDNGMSNASGITVRPLALQPMNLQPVA